jgi:transcriptional regulator with XRE-family HTH domain
MQTSSATDTDRALGQRITALRQLRGLTPTALARAIGVSFPQIRKYESGRNQLSAGRLAQLARVLEVPVSVLVDDELDNGIADVFVSLAIPGALELLQTFATIKDVELRLKVLAAVLSTAQRTARRVERIPGSTPLTTF